MEYILQEGRRIEDMPADVEVERDTVKGGRDGDRVLDRGIGMLKSYELRTGE